MRSGNTHRILPFPLTRFMALTGVVLVVGCEDASVDPTALIVAQETRAAIEFASQVRLLPELMEKHELEHRTASAIELWNESWELDLEPGAVSRRTAYRIAARELVDVAAPIALWDDLAELEELIGAAQTLGEGPLPVDLQVAVDQARQLHERAEEALAAGSHREAVELAFESSDALRSVGPEAVATRLLGRAEGSLEAVSERRNQDADSYQYDEVELERAARMTRGAREAHDDGDYELAIRRAYYAWQILQGAGLQP